LFGKTEDSSGFFGGKTTSCSSRKYPYPPPWDLPYDPPPHHLSGNSNLASYMALNFWAFETPTLPGIFSPFCRRAGVGDWIFYGTTHW